MDEESTPPGVPVDSNASADTSQADRDEAALRVLFLDDDPARAELFLRRYPEAEWVRTAPECVARLAEPWDEVHLDHDLGGEHFVDSLREDCGMEVVRWLCIAIRPQLRHAQFIIHSHNVAAAEKMVECLLDTGYKAAYRPFSIDLLDWLVWEDPSEVQHRLPRANETTVREARRRVAASLDRLWKAIRGMGRS